MLANDGGWTTPEVAEAQYVLVERELAILEQAETHRDNWGLLDEPYTPFLAALDTINASRTIKHGATLLDVGCGVGHYGTVCRRLWPAIAYTGSDVSPHMIRLAELREPGATFLVRDVFDNAFEDYDIVLVSQCLEVTDHPPLNLVRILAHARGVIILHRLRLAEFSGFISESTYAGHIGHNYRWQRAELEQLIGNGGWRVTPIEWATRADMLTMVLWQ